MAVNEYTIEFAEYCMDLCKIYKLQTPPFPDIHNIDDIIQSYAMNDLHLFTKMCYITVSIYLIMQVKNLWSVAAAARAGCRFEERQSPKWQTAVQWSNSFSLGEGKNSD